MPPLLAEDCSHNSCNFSMEAVRSWVTNDAHPTIDVCSCLGTFLPQVRPQLPSSLLPAGTCKPPACTHMPQTTMGPSAVQASAASPAVVQPPGALESRRTPLPYALLLLPTSGQQQVFDAALPSPDQPALC